MYLREVDEGHCKLNLHVQPGAASTGLAGEHDGALKIRIRARAVEGAANTALLDFLAECLSLPRRELHLLRGDHSRRKTIALPLSAHEARHRLGLE